MHVFSLRLPHLSMLANGGEAAKDSHPCSDARAIYDFLKRVLEKDRKIGVVCRTHRSGIIYGRWNCKSMDSEAEGIAWEWEWVTASPVLSSIHACRVRGLGVNFLIVGFAPVYG